ncbi:MAG: ferritin-like domain-containing protein [Gammaproteobacteria bacterium]|nr:ferritin-like domain-containing protein [Gammaproteobacteria bacterium]
MADIDNNLFEHALACIRIDDPGVKASSVQTLYDRWRANELDTVSHTQPVAIPVPGRPERPHLVSPRKVPKRGFKSKPGLLKLAHAITHIEFNAINLALDAVYRFREMPDDYYSDWLRVAAEESSHYLMLASYLEDNGAGYGDYDAHNGLWEMAVKTDHDVMVRMALVPRVLEARGLDVTPGMIDKLEKVGVHELVNILRVIHREEIGHVRIGTRWFNYICQLRGLSPRIIFSELLNDYMKGVIQGPFDQESRLQAGFTEDELQQLMEMSGEKETAV